MAVKVLEEMLSEKSIRSAGANIRQTLCEDEGEALKELKWAVLNSRPAVVEPYPDGEFMVYVKVGG